MCEAWGSDSTDRCQRSWRAKVAQFPLPTSFDRCTQPYPVRITTKSCTDISIQMHILIKKKSEHCEGCNTFFCTNQQCMSSLDAAETMSVSNGWELSIQDISVCCIL